MKYSSWNEFYTLNTPNISNLLLHAEYIFRIARSGATRILEIGCGPATHSLFIKRLMPSVQLSLLDLDKELLESVYATHQKDIDQIYHLDILNTKDIASLPTFDLVISQGLLEHFNDDDFLKIVDNFKPITKRMLFDIPSSDYPTQDFGNEILRSKKEVQDLLKIGSGYRYDVHNMIDIGIRTKQLVIQKHQFNGLRAAQFLLFGSCHLIGDIRYENPV